MKYSTKLLCAAAATFAVSHSAQASNAATVWADTVVDYSPEVINFSHVPMTSETEYWVLGESDGFVAGWKCFGSNQFITVGFDQGLADVAGNDLVLHMFHGPNSAARVLASSNGIDFQEIGNIGGGIGRTFVDQTFDFNGMFNAPVHYVKVERIAHGRQTGLFIDSFGGVAPVPEPSTYALMLGGLGLVGLMAARRKKA